jgi:hypothetical protein
MTNGPPIAHRLVEDRAREHENAGGSAGRRDRQRVEAVATGRDCTPGDVAGFRRPLLGAQRGLPIQNEREDALAGGHGRLERRAGLECQIDQRHRPDRGEGRRKIAERPGVEASLEARLAERRRVRRKDVPVSRPDAFGGGRED